MSNNLPLSAIIFDHSQRGIPDVPIFMDALSKQQISKPKIQNSVPPIAGQSTHTPTIIPTSNFKLQHSAPSADSVTNGQVFAGFAPRAEHKSSLAEDPEIFRHTTATEPLRSYLAKQYVVAVPLVTQAAIPLISQVETRAIELILHPELVGAQNSQFKIHKLPILGQLKDAGSQAAKHAAVIGLKLGSQVLSDAAWTLRLTRQALLHTEETLSPALSRLILQLESTVDALELGIEQIRQRMIAGFEKSRGDFSTLFAKKAADKAQLSDLVTQEKEHATQERTIESVVTFEEPLIDLVPWWKSLQKKLQSLIAQMQRFFQSLPPFHRLASQLMLATSVALMIMTVGPMLILEGQSWKQKVVNSLSGRADDVSLIQPSPSAPPATTGPTPVPTVPPIEQQFQIRIPKIGIDSRVIPNVDAGNEAEYVKALKEGVAHAKGTALPGEPSDQTKTIYIFGHSTNGTWNIARYNALFYNLKDMENGDDISVTFWGNQFNYKVTNKVIVDANDTSYLQPQTSKDQLVLQTCWPPGTSWKRLLVIAEPVK